MRKIFTLLLAVCAFAMQAMAQNRTVTGRVTDENGKPLAGANITVKGNSQGVVSKVDGTFSLSVPPNAKAIIISATGTERVELALSATQSFYTAVLKEKIDPLDEVVVVGYQTRKKRDEAGAISTVKAAQIENLPNVSLDKALQGKAAGVLVQANNGIPGGAINVRIRGAGSINAGNDPLYIVDGLQLNVRNDAAFTQSNPLSYLNPDDIESIDILKDAASAAIYGSNASNGVVLITTKKGKAGKTKFNANAYFGQVAPLKSFDVTNSQQYFQLRSEAYGNNLFLSPTDLTVKRTVLNELRVVGAGSFTVAQADSAAAALQTYDWQSAAIQNANVANYELSASGGNEKTTFRASASFTKQGTILTKADFKRSVLKFDLTNKATDKLTIGTSINLSTFSQNLPFATDGSFLGSPAFSASGIIPANPIYNPDGTYYGIPGGTPANLIGTLNQNIIAVNEFNTGFQRTNQLIGNVTIDYKLTSWLSARIFGGMDFRLVQGKLVRDARTPDAFVRKGLVQTQSNWNTNISTYGSLNFNKTFGKSKLDAVAIAEYRRENNESITASGDGFPTFQFTSLNNAAQPVTIGEFFTGFRRNALAFSANYTYDRRYVIGATYRYDGSSRFGVDNLYGSFFGIKTAWNIDQESFLSNSKIISALRLRLSYGQTGNDQIGNFDQLGLYGGGGVYNGGAGIAFSQLANPLLKWEKNATANVGIDFGLFNNRITGSLEAYDKQTSDLLITQPTQSTSGFTGITSNIGKLQNRGFEITIAADIIKAKQVGGFNWNMSFTLGYNKQEVKELYGGLKILPSNNAIQVGQPVNVLFTQRYAGVNPATGRPMWYDTLGNLTYQVAARDRVLLGPTALPTYQGGFRTGFTFKGFSIDAFFQYEYGRYSSDGQVNFLFENIARINELTYIYDNRWTTPGQITSIPRFNTAGTESKGSGAQSGNRQFFKADYIRLKNLTFSYDLAPQTAKKLGFNNARFYVQGTNLATISDWYSYDIEFVGTATGIIPQTRNVTAGIQLGF